MAQHDHLPERGRGLGWLAILGAAESLGPARSLTRRGRRQSSRIPGGFLCSAAASLTARPPPPPAVACRLSDLRIEVIAEAGAVTSIHLSPCGRYLTANLADSLVHVWQLPEGLAPAAGTAGGATPAGIPTLRESLAAITRERSDGIMTCGSNGSLAGGLVIDPWDVLPLAPVHELRMAGTRPSRYVLRSCIGGANSGFVASGAEDCRLYIWSRRTGELLDCLAGHSGCINATAWHPTHHWLLASASDDGTIRTWLAPAALRA